MDNKQVKVVVTHRKLQEGAQGPKVSVNVPIPTTSEPASTTMNNIPKSGKDQK